jgi:hypothetical protein
VSFTVSTTRLPYQKLAAPPQPLHDPELIEPQHAKQHLDTVRPHPPPRHHAPELSIPPDVRHHSNREIVSRVGERRDEGPDDGAQDEELRDGRVGEA